MPLGLLQFGAWHLGANDNDPLGWTTTAAYALAAIACHLAARAEPLPPRRLFWHTATGFLAALGLNKQLDLQLLALELFRLLTHGESPSQKAHLRHLAAAALLVFILSTATLVLYRLRRHWPGLRLPAAVLSLLLVFVFIRSGTVRHVLGPLNASHYTAVHIALELLPVLAITALALRRRARLTPAAAATATTTPA